MKAYEIVDSVEKLGEAILRTKAAQKLFATYTQEQIDKIFSAAAPAADMTLKKNSINPKVVNFPNNKTYSKFFATLTDNRLNL